MGARGLIVRELTTAGIYFSASEDARPFLDSMDARYLAHLREQCAWAADTFGDLNDEEIRAQLGDVFGSWAEEFEQLNGQEHHG